MSIVHKLLELLPSLGILVLVHGLASLSLCLGLLLAVFLTLAAYFLIIVLLIGPENVCRFHSTTSAGAEEALDHQTSLLPKGKTIVTKPVILRYSLKAIAILMHWYRARGAEHYLILILIFSRIADGATGVILENCLFFLIKF